MESGHSGTIIIGGESDPVLLSGNGDAYIVPEDVPHLVPSHAKPMQAPPSHQRTEPHAPKNTKGSSRGGTGQGAGSGTNSGATTSSTKKNDDSLARGSVPEPLYSLWQLLASITVPESLAVARNVQEKAMQPDFIRRVKPRVEVLQPGDFILIQTPGRVYSFFRRIAGQAYDHMGVMVGPGEFLHIGPPSIRIIPVNALLAPERKPLVLRPVGIKKEHIQAMIDELKTLIGQPYSSQRVYSFIGRMALERTAKITAPLALPRVGDASERFICTDAILLRLVKHSPEFARAVLEVQNERLRKLNRARARQGAYGLNGGISVNAPAAAAPSVGSYENSSIEIVDTVRLAKAKNEHENDDSDEIKLVDDVPRVSRDNDSAGLSGPLSSSTSRNVPDSVKPGLDFFRLHSMSINDILALTAGDAIASSASTVRDASTLSILSPVSSAETKRDFVGFVPVPLPDVDGSSHNSDHVTSDADSESSQTQAQSPSTYTRSSLRPLSGSTGALATSFAQVAGEAVPSVVKLARTTLGSSTQVIRRIFASGSESTPPSSSSSELPMSHVPDRHQSITPGDKLRASIDFSTQGSRSTDGSPISSAGTGTNVHSHLYEDTSIVSDVQQALLAAFSDLRQRLLLRARMSAKRAQAKMTDAAKRILWKIWIQAKPIVRLYVIMYVLAWRYPRLMFIHGKILRTIFYIVLFGTAIRTAVEAAAEPITTSVSTSMGTSAAPGSQAPGAKPQASTSSTSLTARTRRAVGAAAGAWRRSSQDPIGAFRDFASETLEYFLSLGGYPNATQAATGQKPLNSDKLRSYL